MLTTNRRTFIIGASAAALASTTSMKFAFAQERRELRIGVNGVPASLEPVNAISNVGPRIVNQIFDTLITRDWFGNGAKGNGIWLVPQLAESWERIDDKSVRFRLRQNVKFHDGADMTAEDVAYTFSSERLWGNEAIKTIPNGRAFSPDWDEPVVEDKYTVVLRTKTPSFLIERFLASWLGRIVPRNITRASAPSPSATSRSAPAPTSSSSSWPMTASCSRQTTSIGAKSRPHRRSPTRWSQNPRPASPA